MQYFWTNSGGRHCTTTNRPGSAPFQQGSGSNNNKQATARSSEAEARQTPTKKQMRLIDPVSCTSTAVRHRKIQVMQPLNCCKMDTSDAFAQFEVISGASLTGFPEGRSANVQDKNLAKGFVHTP